MKEITNKANISSLPHNDCCGCRACGDICPVNCITFTLDDEGFFFPSVDESICISCGKCVKTCPEFNPYYHKEAKNAIAAFANNQTRRNDGSSGGIFGLLALEVLRKGGKVWGAAFDDKLQLHHQCATSEAELLPLLRSKYLQSNTTGIFTQIIKDVRNNILTLFSGTPCQCNAIINAVGKDTPNLITVEVVCHGIPSQQLFDKSIQWIEDKNNCWVRSFAFRSKFKNALHPQAFTYVCTKGNKNKTVNGLHYQFPFYFGFQKYITLRRSCYSCKWARPQRASDITLGDFWGIEKYNPKLDAKTGISEIIVNTEKGQRIFDSLIEGEQIWAQTFPISVAIENNGCLQAPTKLKPERDALFKALKTKPFDEVVDEYLKSKRQWVFDLYYGMPGFLRKLVRKIMDKRMKYE